MSAALRVESWRKISKTPLGTCATVAGKGESRRVAIAQAQNVYLTGFERGAVAVDGWMGFCDAAAADTGEPHASREAVRVRTGLADAAHGRQSAP